MVSLSVNQYIDGDCLCLQSSLSHTYTHVHRAHLLEPAVADPMRNPLYEKNPSVLQLTVTGLNVTLWKQLYLRTDGESSLSLSGFEAIKELKDTNTALKSTLEGVQT